jgi:hypothetical protein
MLHPEKLAGKWTMGKRLKTDQTDQFVVTEVIQLIGGSDERFGFRDVLDGDSLRGIHDDGLTLRHRRVGHEGQQTKRKDGGGSSKAREGGRGNEPVPPRFF